MPQLKIQVTYHDNSVSIITVRAKTIKLIPQKFGYFFHCSEEISVFPSITGTLAGRFEASFDDNGILYTGNILTIEREPVIRQAQNKPVIKIFLYKK